MITLNEELATLKTVVATWKRSQLAFEQFEELLHEVYPTRDQQVTLSILRATSKMNEAVVLSVVDRIISCMALTEQAQELSNLTHAVTNGWKFASSDALLDIQLNSKDIV
jgi:hypothetical protein